MFIFENKQIHRHLLTPAQYYKILISLYEYMFDEALIIQDIKLQQLLAS